MRNKRSEIRTTIDFFSTFQIDGKTPKDMGLVPYNLTDVHARCDELAHGMGFALFIENSELNLSFEYTYNDLGRMSTATVTTGTGTVTESYLYDWAGTRTAKITDGVLTYYLVDTGGVLSQVLAELDHTGALITHYTRGSELISLLRPGEKHYYLHDGHGSVRALSDSDGQVTNTYLFDAFGNLLSKTGTTANDFLYTGEQYDISTGFYYLRARYMNPSTGTFTSPDAYAGTIFDPVSLHKYLYANANPVMNRDPSGYMAEAFMAGEVCRSILAKQEAEYNSTVIAIGTELITTLISVGTMVAIFVGNNPMFVDLCMRIAAGDIPVDSLRDFIRDLYNQVGDKIADFINDVTGNNSNSSQSSSGGSSSNVQPPQDPIDPNKLNHIFHNLAHDHKLDQFLDSFGGNEESAFRALQQAAQDYVVQHNIVGHIDDIIVNVNGFEITVRGEVIDGFARISTAFIP